jgi:hypothetical protein
MTCALGNTKTLKKFYGVGAKELYSFNVPAGLSLTMYTGSNFDGNFVTSIGPINASCLNNFNGTNWEQQVKSVIVSSVKASNLQVLFYSVCIIACQ